MKSIVKHLKEVRVGGSFLFFKKIKNGLNYLLAAPFILPIIFLVRLVRPFYLIRFGTFRYWRIGHLAADAGILFSRRAISNSIGVDFYFLPKVGLSNQFLGEMVKRNFYVSKFVRYFYKINKYVPGSEKHIIHSSLTGSRDIEGLLEKSQHMFPFYPKENLIGEKWLNSYGWELGNPFVCLLVRDNSYLSNNSYLKNNDWSYHNYRDSDISTYCDAAEWLANQGVWVIRMGKIMKKPFPLNHPKIIDYAFCNNKSDLLDIWLFANCCLCISTGTGPDMLSDIYRKPLLLLNFMPIIHTVSWSNAIHISKHLYWSSTGKLLTMREYLNNAYFDAEAYKENGIVVKDLTKEEILLAIKEAWLSVFGEWVPSEGNSIRQQRVWELFKAHPEFNKLHGYLHPKSRFGDQWLASRPSEFFK